MLIRPDLQIDMANTLNTSVDKKTEKLQALNYSESENFADPRGDEGRYRYPS